MKKILSAIKVIGFMALLVFLTAVAGDIDNSYTMNTRVVSCDNNELVFEDWQHKMWVFDTDKSFNVGDTIKVKYHTNYTEHNRNDDFIMWVKEVK